MPVSRIVHFEAQALSLEVPIVDFRKLPEMLGCTITDEESAFVLTTAQPGCKLTFHPFGNKLSYLGSVEIKDDPQGQFFQQVLGVLMLEYNGNMVCELEWNQPKGERVRVEVTNGVSAYPLLASLVAAAQKRIHPLDNPKVEALMTEAKAAWAEYQRLKASRDQNQES